MDQVGSDSFGQMAKFKGQARQIGPVKFFLSTHPLNLVDIRWDRSLLSLVFAALETHIVDLVFRLCKGRQELMIVVRVIQ